MRKSAHLAEFILICALRGIDNLTIEQAQTYATTSHAQEVNSWNKNFLYHMLIYVISKCWKKQKNCFYIYS